MYVYICCFRPGLEVPVLNPANGKDTVMNIVSMRKVVLLFHATTTITPLFVCVTIQTEVKLCFIIFASLVTTWNLFSFILGKVLEFVLFFLFYVN